MENDPPVVADLPPKNPLFNNPPEPQAQIHEELLMAQRTLREYTLTTLDAVRDRYDYDSNDPKYIAILREHDGGSISTLKAVPLITDDVVHLRLFPFSLCEHVTDWLDSLESSSITTWDILARKFLHEFFPDKQIHSASP
ncbi:Retrotransposon gag protein [Gossypium australe]|uniref:Retrotransposon gag protein n=1 Tax=Gossypium australe TaxID=47621 RepID=A0A5B6UNS5_9ROSI|nr:Retrotransposon gag protein [Gossypium australe]